MGRALRAPSGVGVDREVVLRWSLRIADRPRIAVAKGLFVSFLENTKYLPALISAQVVTWILPACFPRGGRFCFSSGSAFLARSTRPLSRTVARYLPA